MRKFLKGLLLGTALLLSAPQSDAAVLFACGEDIDCNIVGSVTLAQTAGNFNAGYARGSLTPVAAATSVNFPPVNYISSGVLANQSDFWVSFYYLPASVNSVAGSNLINIRDSSGVSRLAIQGSGSPNQLKIVKRNAATTVTPLFTCTGTQYGSTLSKLDVHVVVAVSGSVTLYNNGTVNCTFTGDTTTDAVTSLAEVQLGTQSTSFAFAFSEFIVASTDTRSLRLVTLAPVATGNTQLWAGAASDINEWTLSDATVISDANSNELSQWTIGSLPSGSFSIAAVVQTARITVGATGPQKFRWSLRVSGANFDNGVDVAATTSFAPYSNIWLTSPATSSAWAISEIISGFNSGVQSKP